MTDPLTPPRRNTRRRKLPPLTVDAKGVAAMLHVSKRSIDTYNAAGLLPAPIRLAGRVLWNVRELRRWVDAGMPERATWERLKATRK